MAYVITDACNECGICPVYCLLKAIKSANGKYEIDAKRCVQCGICILECPMNAIVEE